MTKYKIVYDRENCIGAFACSALAPDFYIIADDNKVDLKDAVLNKETGLYELMINAEDLKINMEAAEVCPVLVIKIYEIDDSGNVIKEIKSEILEDIEKRSEEEAAKQAQY